MNQKRCEYVHCHGPLGLGKHQLPNIDTLVHLDADQPRLLPEPVNAADAALPAAAHARTPPLVRLRDLLLRTAAVPEGLPLLWRYGRHERRVHGVEEVEVRDGGARAGLRGGRR